MHNARYGIRLALQLRRNLSARKPSRLCGRAQHLQVFVTCRHVPNAERFHLNTTRNALVETTQFHSPSAQFVRKKQCEELHSRSRHSLWFQANWRLEKFTQPPTCGWIFCASYECMSVQGKFPASFLNFVG